MDPHEGTGARREFAADVLANILMRLPPNTRRLLRLVCRHWRDVVGTRTATNLGSRAKTLVAATGYAYVIDDLSAMDTGSNRRELWTGIGTYKYMNMNIVGTCNGLVCLCDTGGDITVANPVTGEALAIPPLPLPVPIKIYSQSCWHQSYSFSYLPITRRYKLVHVPCWVSGHVFGTVQVITLGEASWRDVPAQPSVQSYTGYGAVSIDGWVYWAASSSEHTERVMSLNLEDERVAPVISLPSVLSDDWKDINRWHLAEVHERLGIVVGHTRSTEVWVMERGEWSRLYTVSMPPHGPHRCLTFPLFVHGEHVLAWEPGLNREGSFLYMHTLIRDAMGAKRGVLEISDTARWYVVGGYIDTTSHTSYRRTFAYVETKEPPSLYRSAAS